MLHTASLYGALPRRCLLVSAFMLFVLPPACARAQVSGSGALRVMSFNIRYGSAADGENRWELRRGMLVGLLRSEAPDLIGLQEALDWQLAELLDSLPGYAASGCGRDDGRRAGEYAAILYRGERLRIDSAGTYWFSDTPEIPGSRHWGNTLPRICSWARFADRRSGKRLLLCNLHLDHESVNARARSTRLLAARIASMPRADGMSHADAGSRVDAVFITGDFNAAEDDTVHRALTAATAAGGAGFRDSYRVLHPDARDAGTYHAFSGTAIGGKIDFIYVSPGVRMLSAEILREHSNGNYPSDHFPVTAIVEIP